jgi:hypothetical protein
LDRDEFLDIDEDRLLEEVLDQPQRVRFAGKAKADAKKALSRVQAQLDLVKAELRLRILKGPEEFALKAKPTKEDIESAITLEPAYQKRLSKLHDAQHEVDVLGVRCNALEHRKSMIEEAVKLVLRDWHSQPNITGKDTREAREAIHELEKNQARKRK